MNLHLDKKPGLQLPARPEEVAPVFQREGKHVVLLLGGRSYRLDEAQARKVMKDLFRIFGDENETRTDTVREKS